MRPSVTTVRELQRPAEPAVPVLRLDSGLVVGQIDPDDAIAVSWRRVRECDVVVLVNRPGLKLPPSALEALCAVGEGGSSLKFEVEVNPAKRTALRYFRYDCRSGLRRRLRVWASALLLRMVARTGNLFQPARLAATSLRMGVLRRLRRELDRFAERILGRLLRSKPVVDRALNGWVLTARFDDFREFAFPAALHVALTKNCNLACVMCPYHAEALRAQHTTSYFTRAERLPEALFSRLIEEAGAHRAHLAFGQYDEPFIYKDFARWAVRAKQAGCTVSITTNGTLLDAEAALRLLAANIDHISFSLDAASHDTYRAIRLDDFEVPLRNLRALVDARNRMGSRTALRACMVVQQKNSHEQEAFYDLIKRLGLDMVSFYNLSTYTNGIWINSVLNFGIEEGKPEARSVCSQLYDQMAVYPDGNVALCCLTTMYVGYRSDVPYVGNLWQNSLEEIWHSERYRRIRTEAFQGKFTNSVCRDCTIWHNYQGRYGTTQRGHRMYQNAYETTIYLR
jgi:radical SAM protein with 4Fe4S-binding SPASM domain